VWRRHDGPPPPGVRPPPDLWYYALQAFRDANVETTKPWGYTPASNTTSVDKETIRSDLKRLAKAQRKHAATRGTVRYVYPNP
jgi:hypothetical protein